MGFLLFPVLAAAVISGLHARFRNLPIAVQAAHVIFAALIYFGIELASLLGTLNSKAIFFACLSAIVPPAYLSSKLAWPGGKFPKLDLRFAVLFSVLFLLLLIALFSPPNTWDSMAYHMTRVFFWEQNGSIAHFATANSRQLSHQTLAEYYILFFRLLEGGGDHTANLPQYLSLLMVLLAAWEISKKIGLNSKESYLALGLILSCPAILHQSTSTQNDLSVAGFMLIGLNFILEKRDFSLLAAFSFACAAATKPSGAFFVFAAMVFFLLKFPKRTIKLMTITFFVALLMQAPLLVRNWKSFSNLQGYGPYIEQMRLPGFSLELVTVNFLANLLSQLALPFSGWNAFLHKLLEPWASSGVFLGEFWPNFNINHEDYANSGVLFFLFIIMLPWQKQRRWGGIALLSVLTFSVFVRWQIWNVRLFVPVYCLWALAIGSALPNIPADRRRYVSTAIWSLVVPIGLISLVTNVNRPLMGPLSVFQAPRAVLYFTGQPGIMRDYLGAIDAVLSTPCRSFSVMAEPDSYEYPLYHLVNQHQKIRFGTTIDACGTVEIGSKSGLSQNYLFVSPSIRVAVKN